VPACLPGILRNSVLGSVTLGYDQSLQGIVSGSLKDYNDPNDPAGLDLHRMTEADGVSRYWIFKSAGGKRVQLPNRELNSSSLVQSERVVALPNRCTPPYQRVGLEQLDSIEDELHEALECCPFVSARTEWFKSVLKKRRGDRTASLDSLKEALYSHTGSAQR